MSTALVSLLRRSEFNASFLNGGVTRTITLPTINVSPFYYATLIVRVHEATWSGGASFSVSGWSTYPSPEDEREFVATTTSLTASLSTADTLPAVSTSTASGLPVAYKFIGTITQGSASDSDLFVVASVDLLLRTI
jgi:hypothetical protein